MEEFDPEVRLKERAGFRADGLQVPARLVITAHEKMLPVVHNVAGDFIDKGIRSSPKMLSLFKESDRVASTGKLHSRTEAAEPSADDEHAGMGTIRWGDIHFTIEHSAGRGAWKDGTHGETADR